ncbi:Uncharacterised protein [Vibrio cholerae]|nr:Uncharacterised protein [Vibrio cholerae]CSI15326.1 Uncharacterised protein [Vibrio cholerae]CSI49258.1 Uncharacterised protein [Vibrio cholerae]
MRQQRIHCVTVVHLGQMIHMSQVLKFQLMLREFFNRVLVV